MQIKINNNHFLNNVFVFYARIPERIVFSPVSPKSRNDEINSIANEELKREKYTAWRLLEYALCDLFSLSLDEADLKKDENGKWKSPKCEFSISHGHSCVAVAISHAPVGIDIEPTDTVLKNGFAKRFLTEEEYSAYTSCNNAEKEAFLLTRWCIKEAVFKKHGVKAFAPSKTTENNENVFTKRIFSGEKEFVLAVVTEPSVNEVIVKEVALS